MDLTNELQNRTLNHFTLHNDLTSELGFIAAKIAFYNFEWRFVTLIMFNTAHAVGLNTFLQNYQKAVIIKLGRFLPARRSGVPQFVIFGADSSEISSTLRWIVRSKYDSNGKFVIICAIPNHDCDEQKIFQSLEKLYITNVVVLKTLNKTKESLAYSYYFISHGKCKNNLPYRLDLNATCKNDECFQLLYPDKLQNFHRCRIVVSTIQQPPFMYLLNGTRHSVGIDSDIMNLASDMLNATLVLSTSADDSDSGHFADSNWTGSLGDIYNGRRHISACSAPLTSNKYGNFQISFTYYSMDIVWATRLPAQKASWEKLLYPLNIYFRFILLFIFVCIIFMNILCKTNMWREIRRAFKVELPKYSFFFYSWIIFLGMPIIRTPVRKSFLLTVYTWIWFSFIVRSAYQAALINSLKQPAYDDNFKTFQDVLRAGYPYGGLASLKDYYYDDREIYDNWVVLDLEDLYETIESILDGTSDFVLALNKEIIKHHVMKHNGKKQLQIIPEKIVNSPTVVYFKKYSPLTNPVSCVLRTAFEAGFIHRAYEWYLDKDKMLLKRYHYRGPEPLRMDHFAGCFAILLVGWSLSITYFAVEYVCGNLKD